MKCNICGGDSFKRMNNRPDAKCGSCGSLERTRLMWLYLDELDLPARCRILHVAPERCLVDKLMNAAKSSGGSYLCSDINVELYSHFPNFVQIDLCNLGDWPTSSFDLIVHSHVLEHTPCNIAYTLFHLHRMLATNGKIVCVIPIMTGHWDESFQNLDDESRRKRFGQHDHVRRFGVEDLNMHLGKIIRLPDHFDATEFFSQETLSSANIPKSSWTGFTPDTVLILEKEDFKLSI